MSNNDPIYQSNQIVPPATKNQKIEFSDYPEVSLDDILHSESEQASWNAGKDYIPQYLGYSEVTEEPINESGWREAKPETFPHKVKVICKRKDMMYFGTFAHIRGPKVYIWADGGTNSFPRLVDWWRPIPEDWETAHSVSRTQKRVTWSVSPQKIIDNPNIVPLLTVTVNNVKGIRMKVYSIEPYVDADSDSLKVNISAGYSKMMGIDPSETCLYVTTNRQIRRKELDRLVMIFGEPSFISD